MESSNNFNERKMGEYDKMAKDRKFFQFGYGSSHEEIKAFLLTALQEHSAELKKRILEIVDTNVDEMMVEEYQNRIREVINNL